MSQEILYTSAPRGLKPGSRGFCTVQNTQGMSAILVEKLESLSGYKHIFMPHDALAHLNPVAWSHFRLVVGGRTHSLLSRISDFKADYTGRSNKLAHHVVLDSNERCGGGPAWALSQVGFMQTDWDEKVRLLSRPRPVPPGDAKPEICRAWELATGDAGWAGIIAQAHLDDHNRLVYLTFQPGTDLLPLIREAISLLPIERRWDVTFSTYFTNLPPDVKCAWRCVPKGSPEENNARRFPTALRIDLTEPLGKAADGSLVYRARTGSVLRDSVQTTSNLQHTDDDTAGLLQEPKDNLDIVFEETDVPTLEEADAKVTAFPPALHGTYAVTQPVPPKATAVADLQRPPKLKQPAKGQRRPIFWIGACVAITVGMIWGIWHATTSARFSADDLPNPGGPELVTSSDNRPKEVNASTDADSRNDKNPNKAAATEIGASTAAESSSNVSAATSPPKGSPPLPETLPVARSPEQLSQDVATDPAAGNSSVEKNSKLAELAYIALPDAGEEAGPASFPWPPNSPLPRKIQILQPKSRRPLRLKCKLKRDPADDSEGVAFKIIGEDIHELASLTLSFAETPEGQEHRDVRVRVSWSKGLDTTANQECLRASVFQFPDNPAASKVALAMPVTAKHPQTGGIGACDYYARYATRPDKKDLPKCDEFFPSDVVITLRGEHYRFELRRDQSKSVLNSPEFDLALLDDKYAPSVFFEEFQRENGPLLSALRQNGVELPTAVKSTFELENLNPSIHFFCSGTGEIRLQGEMTARMRIPKDSESDELLLPLTWKAGASEDFDSARKKIESRKSFHHSFDEIHRVISSKKSPESQLSSEAMGQCQRALFQRYHGAAARHSLMHIMRSIADARLSSCVIREHVGQVEVDRIRFGE